MSDIFTEVPKRPPNRDTKAEPIAWAKPNEGQLVVYVEKAIFKGAKIDAGYFFLADDHALIDNAVGITQLQIDCLWFGIADTNQRMQLTVFGLRRLVKKHDGVVITDIGRRVVSQ